MNARILNRDFAHPADGWYQIEPKGEHLNASAGVKQVIDDEAIKEIVNRFNADADAGKLSHGSEMLIDHEHFKHDAQKETRAYGWLQRLQNRADGYYGRIRWSGTGRKAVDEGDYRFFSTEYDPNDLKILNRDEKVISARPLRLDGLTLTNSPNNKGGKPITNRDENALPHNGATPNAGEQAAIQNRKTTMKLINEELGLSPDAAESVTLGELRKLKNRAETAETKVTTLTGEKTTLTNRLAEFDTEQIAGLLEARNITDENIVKRITNILKPITNREERVACLDDLGFKLGEAKETQEKPGQTKLFNRAGKAPAGGKGEPGDTKAAEREKATKIMNRAQEIEKRDGVSLSTATLMAQRELGGK